MSIKYLNSSAQLGRIPPSLFQASVLFGLALNASILGCSESRVKNGETIEAPIKSAAEDAARIPAPEQTPTRISTASVGELTLALKDKDKSVRVAAALVLHDKGSEAKPAISTLVEMMVDEDREIRAVALGVMSGFNASAKVGVPALLQTLKSEEREVRRLVIKALGEIGPKANAAAPTLLELLETQDEEERNWVAEALFQISPEALPFDGADQPAP